VGKWLTVALVVVSGLAIPRAVAAQGFTLSVIEVLDQYDRHQDETLDTLSRIEHLGTIEDALNAEGDAWINALGPGSAPRRRLVAATFALEAARVVMDEEWAIGSRLVEWGCATLRRQKAPLPAERLWHRAALALIEGAYDFEFLTNPVNMRRTGPSHHLDHVKSRFPDDPSIVAAHAFMATRPVIWPPSNRLGDSAANGVPSETVARLQDALKVSSLADEAHVRLAFLDLLANRFDAAFAHLDAADRLTTDPDLTYLSALFRGWASARQQRTDEAIAGYRRAMRALPDMQTATLALGAALVSQGKREEASRLVEQALAANLLEDTREIRDPWLLFGYGDFRVWPRRIAELREALK
jgi:tetratricopeptide (TPR) repeat protein